MARLQIAAAALLALLSLLTIATTARYVDRHRELQDVVMNSSEEEVGEMGHE